MKTTYIKPEIEVIKMDPITLIAASLPTGSGEANDEVGALIQRRRDNAWAEYETGASGTL